MTEQDSTEDHEWIDHSPVYLPEDHDDENASVQTQPQLRVDNSEEIGRSAAVPIEEETICLFGLDWTVIPIIEVNRRVGDGQSQEARDLPKVETWN